MSQSSIDAKDIPLLVFDFETTMRGKDRNPSAWVRENKPLCLGIIYDNTASVVPTLFDCTATDSVSVINDALILRIQNKPLLVGHHMQFDLSYMMRFYTDAYMKMRELNMWDTQVAAYMLDAHLHKFPSLKSALGRANLDPELKSDLLEITLSDKKNNKSTEDIPMKDLMAYCGSDCSATYRLAVTQMNMAQAIDPKLVILIMQRSSLAAPLAEMEMQGLAYDVKTSLASLVRKEAEKQRVKLDIGSALAKRILDITRDTNLAAYITSNLDDYIGSNSMWGRYLFGGSHCFSYKVPDGVYRSGTRKGRLKLKTQETIVEFPARVDAKQYGSSRTKTGCWSLDTTVLDNLLRSATALPTEDKWLVSMLSTYRYLCKIIQTYLLPLQEAIVDGKIHPSIHQTSTVTGRLSQSDPNLQNIANIKEIKSCFTPSSLDLCFIEADYKQLEMIAFAYVYRDPMLLEDLRKGVDIHEMIGRKLYGTGYSPEVRRGVKGVNFGMIYGGGANTIAKQVGLSYNEVLRIIGYFQDRYSTIKGTRQALMSDIGNNFRACPFKYDDRLYGIYTSETGRRYALEMEARTTDRGLEWSPWYTHVCNYPIQGLATGDIVPMMLLHIWRRINEQSLPITIINTVHDSFLFEVPKVETERLGLWIKEELEKAPEVYERWFGKEFDLALPVSVKYTNDSWHGPWKEINPF